MKRRCLAGLLAALLATSPATSRAEGLIPIPIPDPTLALILRVLEQIHEIRLMHQRGIQTEIYNRLRGYAFPSDLFETFSQFFANVGGIRREIQELACGWRFSARADLLRGIYLRKTAVCRPWIESLWGRSDRYLDADLNEVVDFNSVILANTVSEAVNAEETWVRVFSDQVRDTAQRRKSPGEAARDTAANVAWASSVMLNAHDVLRQWNTLEELDLLMERREERRARTLSSFLLRNVAGRQRPEVEF